MKNRGFSLIELLVVVGLLAMVMAGISGLLAIIVKNNQKAEKLLALRKEGNTAVDSINRALTSGRSIITPTCVTVSGMEEGDILEIGYLDGTTVEILCNPTTSILSVDGTNLIGDNSQSTIEDCTFECININNNNQFSFALTLSVGESQEAFSAKTVMRNKQSTDES
jgi:prepilin-type N-terminal cleavage/methylation domain-containing protein